MTNSSDPRQPVPLSPVSPFKRRPLDPAPDNLPAVTDDDDADLVPVDYDPADYRWVPVRRRPRLDGWTEEKQRRFIEVLAGPRIAACPEAERAGSIMIPALRHLQHLILAASRHAIHQPMLVIDPPRPPA